MDAAPWTFISPLAVVLVGLMVLSGNFNSLSAVVLPEWAVPYRNFNSTLEVKRMGMVLLEPSIVHQQWCWLDGWYPREPSIVNKKRTRLGEWYSWNLQKTKSGCTSCVDDTLGNLQ